MGDRGIGGTQTRNQAAPAAGRIGLEAEKDTICEGGLRNGDPGAQGDSQRQGHGGLPCADTNSLCDRERITSSPSRPFSSPKGRLEHAAHPGLFSVI